MKQSSIQLDSDLLVKNNKGKIHTYTMDPPEECLKRPEGRHQPADLRHSNLASLEKATYRHVHNRTPPSSTTSKQVRRQYRLGDAARPSDMNIPQSVGEHVAAVEKLTEGSHCFILRSDFSFTYALVTKQEAGMLEVEVNKDGGSKCIPRDHWKKYIRTLSTPCDSPKKHSPIGGQSKQVRSRHHMRRSTMTDGGYERSPPHRHSSDFVTSSGRKEGRNKPDFRSSMPDVTHGRREDFNRSHSEFRRQRYYSSSGSDDSSTGSSREVERPKKSSAVPKLPFTKDYVRSETQKDRPSFKRQTAQPRRRVSVSDERPSIPSIPTKEFKRSVSIQEGGGDIPVKKCLKSDLHKRSQSEGGQYRRHDSSESDSSSSCSLESSFSFNSTDDDDDSLRAQEKLDKLLSKSMSSLKQGRGGLGSSLGAFGDVTKIEILD